MVGRHRPEQLSGHPVRYIEEMHESHLAVNHVTLPPPPRPAPRPHHDPLLIVAVILLSLITMRVYDSTASFCGTSPWPRTHRSKLDESRRVQSHAVRTSTSA